MTNYRKFQISDDLFWGYNEMININLYINSNDIILELKERLKIFLHRNNLEVLKEKVDEKHYTIPTFEKILVSKPTDIIYVCMCNHINI